jgi:hypothetical protein
VQEDSVVLSREQQPAASSATDAPAEHSAGAGTREDIAPARSTDTYASLAAPDSTGLGSTGKSKVPECPEGYIYADYGPLLLQQKAEQRVIEFETFDAALDEYYSKV